MSNAPTNGSTAVCPICPRACRLAEGQCGSCLARVMRGGEVVAENYGRATSLALDPVEKKPFALWRPGARILSVGSYGCNLICPFCQNHSISQAGVGQVPWRELSPEQLVDLAVRLRPQGNIGIAFTYNEPLVGFEYVLDAAKLAHEAGLAVALVSNGMVNAGPLHELLPYLDAVNIDLKGFSEETYARCGFPGLAAVKRAIQALAAAPNCHIEVTSLIVPGFADAREMERAAEWLASLNPQIPYHITQYHPAFRMQATPALPNRVVREYARRAEKHLANVFTGNM